MLLNDDTHVRGIFKYADNIKYEEGDFVVDGDCIYICKSGEGVSNVKPSEDEEHRFYSEYPGDKITSASEYYAFLSGRPYDNGELPEDKYVSSHSLCEILENMYFGFGDNGILYDHIIYNPGTGIEYSVRGVDTVLNYSVTNVLDRVIRQNDLNNGFLRVSRNLPEVRDILLDNTVSDCDIVVLKQYTYLNSNDSYPYRVQELMDPEKNRLYFRFSKGERLEDGSNDFTDATVSQWKNVYSTNEDAINKLNTIDEYYNERLREKDEEVERTRGKFCYREVEKTNTNHLGSNSVELLPGGTKDIKSVGSFTLKPCLLNVLIKVPVSSGVYRNYSVVIDAKDPFDSGTGQEVYMISDSIRLTSQLNTSGSIQKLTLNTNSGVIKSIYYRDDTLGHVHNWELIPPYPQPTTCTEPVIYNYQCTGCGETFTETTYSGHSMTGPVPYQASTCTIPGHWEYYHCNVCGNYYHDQSGNDQFSGWNTGNDPVEIPASGSHNWGEYIIDSEATCTTPGRKHRTCSNCPEIDEVITPALGHNIGQQIPLHAASCGEYGIAAHYHCSRPGCDMNFSDQAGLHPMSASDLEILPSGNHSFGSGGTIEITPSTYTDHESNLLDMNNNRIIWPEFGEEYKICTNCGNYVKRASVLKTHYHTGTYVTQHSETYTKYNDGSNVYILHYPSYTEFVSTDQSDPGYGTTVRNYNWWGSGSLEHTIVPIWTQLLNHKIDHTAPDTVHFDATCDSYAGWRGTCVICGEHDVVEYDFLGAGPHHVIDTNNTYPYSITPNDCTTSGVITGHCSVCGQNNVSQIDPNHKIIGHRDVGGNHECDICHASLPE